MFTKRTNFVRSFLCFSKVAKSLPTAAPSGRPRVVVRARRGPGAPRGELRQAGAGAAVDADLEVLRLPGAAAAGHRGLLGIAFFN